MTAQKLIEKRPDSFVIDDTVTKRINAGPEKEAGHDAGDAFPVKRLYAQRLVGRQKQRAADHEKHGDAPAKQNATGNQNSPCRRENVDVLRRDGRCVKDDDPV